MLSKDDTNPIKLALDKPLSVLFYALFTFFYNYHFMCSTMLYVSHWKEYNDTFRLIYDHSYYVLLGLAIISVLFLYDSISERIIPIITIIVVLLFNHSREITTFKAVATFFLLAVSAKGKRIKIWGWIAFVSGWIWLVISFIATRTGYIMDLSYDSGKRHALGSIYPTDLGCHILTLSMMLCLIKSGKLKIYDYLYLIAMMCTNLLFIKAKVSFACMFLLFCGCIYAQYISPKIRPIRGLTNAYNASCVMSFAFFALATCILTLLYSPDSDSIFNKIRFLGSIKSRFRQGNEAFHLYPLSLWGTYIREQGAGAKIEDEITYYFFLDISYVRIILLNGIGVFTLMMVHYTKTVYRLAKNKLYLFMLIIVIFALDCAVEHHIIEIAYCLPGFLLYSLPNTKSPISSGEQVLSS